MGQETHFLRTRVSVESRNVDGKTEPMEEIKMRKLLVFFSRHRNCENESQGVKNKSELGDEKNRLLRNLYFFLQFDFAVMHEIRFAIQRLLLKFIKKI